MKGVIISACIAVVLIAGSIAYTNHIDTVSENFVEMNQSIVMALEEDDFETAEKEIVKMVEYMDKKATVLAATGNHEDLDKIEMNLSELVSYIRGGNQTDALARCNVLGFLFEHLPKNYKLKLENIL